MFEWQENDRLSFDDSDRFEEDSLCSWCSEPESLCNNWRGWKKSNIGSGNSSQNQGCSSRRIDVLPLVELCSKTAAAQIPFEVVEQTVHPVPENLQLRIAFWSFPDNEEDIRLYSCLANGSAEEYAKGEALYKSKAVWDIIQIGFHLSATVYGGMSQQNGSRTGKNSPFNVSITFDRRHITSCTCSCGSNASFCSHIVAVSLFRIGQGQQVALRLPISESLLRLDRSKFQKFAQYLLSELPRSVLPIAQGLLDDLLRSDDTEINMTRGAPDPTAGGLAGEASSWCMDTQMLVDNMRKILIKFCVPSPTVFSDVNYLSTSAPPAASEYTSLLRPLRGREPEGMWNLLQIVRELFKRRDGNAVPLLQTVTLECLSCEQIMVWWFNTNVAFHSGTIGHGAKSSNVHSNTHASQHACASLCDEVVDLWRLAALNPAISPEERKMFKKLFRDWHLKVVDKVAKSRGMQTPVNVDLSGLPSNGKAAQSFRIEIELFEGFKPALRPCFFDWEDYTISGVTYNHESRRFYSPIACFRNSESHNICINASSAVLKNKMPHQLPHQRPEEEEEWPPEQANDGNRSSVSSEGFCENNGDAAAPTALSDQPPQLSDFEDSSNSTDKDKSSSDTDSELQEMERNSSLSTCRSPEIVIGSPEVEEIGIFSSVKPLTDPFEIKFARVEALLAHGWQKYMVDLVVELSTDLLANPPDLMVQIPPYIMKGRKKKANPLCHQISLLASATLYKCHFLASFLSDRTDSRLELGSDHLYLAFHVAIFGLELPRPPATTKPLEVKLAHQESELVRLLEKVPLGYKEMQTIREKATMQMNGTYPARGEALLPLNIAFFLFEALANVGTISRSPHYGPIRIATDEGLGFSAALAALSMKANVSEADHPLLCEGTRRQRGDLAILLICHYRDDPEKLARIMDVVLDSSVHKLFPTSLPSCFYSNGPINGRLTTTSQRSNQRSRNRNPPTAELSALNLNNTGDGPLPVVSVVDGVSEPGCSTWRGGPGSDSGSSGSSSEGLQPNNLTALVSVPPPAIVPSKPLMIEQVTPPKSTGKGNRFKSKRAYPSLPNQPSEAFAHFMFELAKNILTKAGGSSSNSLFTHPPAPNQNTRGPHRGLHMVAFQIGLYALGLHNRVSPNWLSRTYSSHVSWISSQAMELGAPAIWFLISVWEGHLTPPEAASIADRASRGHDTSIELAAAELALSCVSQAHALNPNEITRAIQQCKEQNDEMLERACLNVESAAKGGAVHPEVLFLVAKKWFELYEQKMANLPRNPNGHNHEESPQSQHQHQPQPPVNHQMIYPFFPAYSVYPVQPVILPPHPGGPYPFVPQALLYGHPLMMPNPQNGPPPPFSMVSAKGPYIQPGLPGPAHGPRPQNNAHIRFLLSAYRVGLVAMETLARRAHDERPQAKYARSPPYGDDVKWLLIVAKKLGTEYLQQFCLTAASSIVSPHVLHDIAVDAAHHLAQTAPAPFLQPLRSRVLAPLMQKCMQMYIHCIHHKLYHHQPADQDELVAMIQSARTIFHMTPTGPMQFNELIQSLQRSKQCNKDLWAKITNCLRQPLCHPPL
ncbi:zinc finger SWIM domain-containing protein 8 homolog isoform X2 [Artemia franciscana]|uniref:zinc finger SWIM domain-containing protein 8 homolog isoform X2 n=1 Tax=Artemia franciscana TaxID=6661 RepID=UPI0032DBAEF7